MALRTGRWKSQVARSDDDALAQGGVRWQLALMSATSIALSVASGWTTWDGMTQFTSVPLLSALITFGIQGVMLVTAWLIGENIVARRAARSQALTRAWQGRLRRRVWRIGSTSRISAAALWIMFATSLSASVFFSFDSLFNEVFSENVRAEAGRTRVEIAASDVLDQQARVLDRRMHQAVSDLLASQAWNGYLARLASLEDRARIAQEAESEAVRMQATERARAAAAATGDQRELEAKLLTARQRVTAAKAEIHSRDEAVAAARQALASTDHKVSSLEETLLRKQAEANAEAHGVGPTSKSGKGPHYRQLMREATALEIELETAKALQRSAHVHLAELETAREQSAMHLPGLEGKAAEVEARLATGTNLLSALTGASEVDGESAAPTQVRVEKLRQAVAQFTTEPDEKHLEILGQACARLRDRVDQVMHNPPDPAALACNDGGVAALARAVFAVREIAGRYAASCGAGKRPAVVGTEDVLRFADTCISLAALPAAEAGALRERLRTAELRRDDRAHRLIVSWNAFSDLNPLAALALAIAVGIDGLVFFSGVGGALARGSRGSTNAPKGLAVEKAGKSAVPAPQAELRRLINAALAGQGEKVALHLLEHAHPIGTDCAQHHAYDLRAATPSLRPVMAQVLNAGIALGTLRYDQRSGICVISPEFYALLVVHAEQPEEKLSVAPASTLQSEQGASAPVDFTDRPESKAKPAASAPVRENGIAAAVASRIHENSEPPRPKASRGTSVVSMPSPRHGAPASEALARVPYLAPVVDGKKGPTAADLPASHAVPQDMERELKRAGQDAMAADYPVARLLKIHRIALDHARNSAGEDAVRWRQAATEARRLASLRIGFGEDIMP